jgi:hypothetical protein
MLSDIFSTLITKQAEEEKFEQHAHIATRPHSQNHPQPQAPQPPPHTLRLFKPLPPTGAPSATDSSAAATATGGAPAGATASFRRRKQHAPSSDSGGGGALGALLVPHPPPTAAGPGSAEAAGLTLHLTSSPSLQPAITRTSVNSSYNRVSGGVAVAVVPSLPLAPVRASAYASETPATPASKHTAKQFGVLQQHPPSALLGQVVELSMDTPRLATSHAAVDAATAIVTPRMHISARHSGGGGGSSGMFPPLDLTAATKQEPVASGGSLLSKLQQAADASEFDDTAF